MAQRTAKVPRTGWSDVGQRRAEDMYLLSYRADKYMTQRALTNTLKRSETHGIPTKYSRSEEYRARKRVVASEISTPYGPIVKEMALKLAPSKKKAGGPMADGVAAVQAPGAMLYELCRCSSWFSDCVRDALAQHPCSQATPWTIALYGCGLPPSRSICIARDI